MFLPLPEVFIVILSPFILLIISLTTPNSILKALPSSLTTVSSSSLSGLAIGVIFIPISIPPPSTVPNVPGAGFFPFEVKVIARFLIN